MEQEKTDRPPEIRDAPITKHVEIAKDDRDTQAKKNMKYNASILEDMSHIIDAEPQPELQSILRHTIGWLSTKTTKEIEVDYLQQYLLQQEGENTNFYHLFRVSCFMVVYVVMVLLHEDMKSAGLLQRFLTKKMAGSAFEGVNVTAGHKNMFDIDTKEDLYNFLKEVMLPLFMPKNVGKTFAEEAPGEIYRSLRYNRVIGGVHLLQRRYRSRSCAAAWPALGPIYDGRNPLLDGFECFGAASGEKMTDDCYGPLDVSVRRPGDRARYPSGFCADHSVEGMDMDTSTQSSSSTGDSRRLIIGKSKRNALKKPASTTWFTGLGMEKSDTYSVLFFQEDGLEHALKRLEWLQENDWVDLQTQYVGARVFVFNPELSLYSHASVENFFGHSGEIVAMIQMTTFRAEPYQQMSVIVADVFFVVFLLYNVLELYARLFHDAYRGKLRDWCSYGWNWVHAWIVHYGLVIMCMWVMFFLRLEGVKDRIVDVSDPKVCSSNETETMAEKMARSTGPMMKPDDPVTLRCLRDLHDDINDLAIFLARYRVLMAIYTVSLILRFFKVFAKQPRCAMVLRTLHRSSEGVFHHLIVFVVLMLGFSLSGVLLLGRRLSGFANINFSFNTLFRMLFGDFDWESLSAVDPITVGFWFYCFTFSCALLMVNMFMAIIMDVYVEVKANAVISYSAWTQLYLIVQLWFKSRSWVSTTVLARVLRETFQKPFLGRSVCAKIDAGMLVQVIPGMSQAQAEFYIDGALARKEAEESLEVTLVDACKMIGDIAIVLRTMNARLNAIVAEMKDERDDLAAALKKVPSPRLALTDTAPEADASDSAEPRPLPHVPCAKFRKRAAALEIRLQQIADFAEDVTCWQAYRGKEVHEHMCKIEELVKECTELIPKMPLESNAGRTFADIVRQEPEPPVLLQGSLRNNNAPALNDEMEEC